MEHRTAETATGKVIAYFIEETRGGRWKVGDKIPSENQLTELVGVSRLSVRSAIQQAVGIGAMETYRGSGTYLLDDDLSGLGQYANFDFRSKKTMRSFLEFRLILETSVASLAAVRRTKRHLANLERLYGGMVDSEGDQRNFVRCDMQFHEVLAKACGNDFITVNIVEIYRSRNEIFFQFNEEFGYRDGLYHHGRLLEAVRQRDPEAAERFMRIHLESAIERLDGAKATDVLKR